MENLAVVSLTPPDTSEGWAFPPSASRASLAADTVLDGTYRIVRPLAQGGMGEVYLASHERLPGYFAVKALQRGLTDQPESLARFRREAEIVAGIRHPNVVQVFDFNLSAEGVPYLVMEFIEGCDLGSELRTGRKLCPSETMVIIRQVGSALAAAHAVGVVHRDLKPENIVLVPAPGQAPIVKVIDFGISISGVSPRITTDSRVMGTPEFMSPEQALGKRDEIDARSDQFALAVLAHTMLARQPPFHGDTPMATLSAIVFGEPTPLSGLGHIDWPAAEVEQVLRKGMARVRDDRYGSVLDFTDALEAALNRSGALAEPAPISPSVAVVPASPSAPVEAIPSSPSSNQRLADAATMGAGPVLEMTAEPAGDEEPLTADELAVVRGGAAFSTRMAAMLLLMLMLGGGLLMVELAAPAHVRRVAGAATAVARTQWVRGMTGAGHYADKLGVFLGK
jgi:serine/threonine protein kinase